MCRWGCEQIDHEAILKYCLTEVYPDVNDGLDDVTDDKRPYSNRRDMPIGAELWICKGMLYRADVFLTNLCLSALGILVVRFSRFSSFTACLRACTRFQS